MFYTAIVSEQDPVSRSARTCDERSTVYLWSAMGGYEVIWQEDSLNLLAVRLSIKKECFNIIMEDVKFNCENYTGSTKYLDAEVTHNKCKNITCVIFFIIIAPSPHITYFNNHHKSGIVRSCAYKLKIQPMNPVLKWDVALPWKHTLVSFSEVLPYWWCQDLYYNIYLTTSYSKPFLMLTKHKSSDSHGFKFANLCINSMSLISGGYFWVRVHIFIKFGLG